VPLQGFPVSSDGTVGPDNQLRYIRTNFGDRQEMSVTLGINKSFFKQAFTTNFNFGVQRNVNNGTLGIDPTTGDRFQNVDGQLVNYSNQTKSTSFFIQTNNTLRLDKKKTWFLGVNYFYVDQQQIELGLLNDLMSLDFNIKKIWNDWTFMLNVNDVLRTNIVEIEDFQENGNYNYVKNDGYRQNVGVSIVYNFGNKKVKKVREISDASSDVKSRTR
ncbi:MAG: outer membrane beta-barrel protein, partial [Kaistella sp.]